MRKLFLLTLVLLLSVPVLASDDEEAKIKGAVEDRYKEWNATTAGGVSERKPLSNSGTPPNLNHLLSTHVRLCKQCRVYQSRRSYKYGQRDRLAFDRSNDL
jgi:hypothetical protein